MIVSNRPISTDKYQQSSALPYRFRKGKLEFCLITSMKRRRWCFPKGLIDPGETPLETALKEAEEEGGLQGAICGEPLGSYRYFKWGQNLNVLVLLMEVEKAGVQWEEMQSRDRKWVAPERAIRMIEQETLHEFVKTAAKRLGYAMSK